MGAERCEDGGSGVGGEVGGAGERCAFGAGTRTGTGCFGGFAADEGGGDGFVGVKEGECCEGVLGRC